MLAATPKSVKAADDLANGKYTAQDATTAQKGIVPVSYTHLDVYKRQARSRASPVMPT